MRNTINGQFIKRSRLSYLQEKENKQIRKIRRQNEYLTAFVLGIFTAVLISGLFKRPQITSPHALKQTIDNKVVVNATTDKYIERGYVFCYDPIICIRDVGEELGMSNKDILIAINIAKKESGMRPDAIGKNSNGTYDIGLMQINDVHSKRISRQDRLDFEKNIRFAYKLRIEQGNWNAWSVCKSKVNCK